MDILKTGFWAAALAAALASAPAPAEPDDTAGRKTAEEEPRRGLSREELPGPPLHEGALVPRGARADVFLWKDAIDAQDDLVIQRHLAEDLLRRFQRERRDERLAERATRAPEADRLRILEVRKRLGFAWAHLGELMSRPWPVDPRLRCRRQLNDFTSILGASASDRLPAARVELKGCLQKLRAVLNPLRKDTGELIAAFAESDEVLAPKGDAAPATSPTGPAPAGPGRGE